MGVHEERPKLDQQSDSLEKGELASSEAIE